MQSLEVTQGRQAVARTVGVRKTYGKDETAVNALADVSIEFPAGQFTAVMGPSGSGKSTLMHCLAALDRPSAGQVFIGDTEISGMNDSQLTKLRRERIGFVFQAFNLMPQLSAKENILLPLRLAKKPLDQAWMDEIVQTVGLTDRLAHRPGELSGGQQQRVAIARALASHPDIVFADEPTGNLDSTSGTEVLDFMRKSVDEHDQSIVMVTHDPAAAGYADWVVFLKDGQIVQTMDNPTSDRVLDAMKALG